MIRADEIIIILSVLFLFPMFPCKNKAFICLVSVFLVVGGMLYCDEGDKAAEGK